MPPLADHRKLFSSRVNTGITGTTTNSFTVTRAILRRVGTEPDPSVSALYASSVRQPDDRLMGPAAITVLPLPTPAGHLESTT